MEKIVKPCSILLVEDNPLVAFDAADRIESEGYRCIVAHDQSSALKLLENGRIDCALLDFDLGRETSADVALRLDRSGRPYVFVTGRSRDDIRRCLGSDVQVFSKPVNYADLANRLAETLGA